MNLVELRERLKAIDAALSEVQKAVSRAGSELIKAYSGVGDMMGEDVKVKRKPRVEKAVPADTNGQEPATTISMAGPAKRRGRPHRQQEGKQSNSEADDEAPV